MTQAEHETILTRSVDEEMRDSYLRYSMSVIISRALPDVRDGLKPSQRRILYAMRQLNLTPGAKHRKCAKICGDTSGDFHPHGETVVYPTLARMAQSWVMRYTMVQGQGNFGSVDGDPPAAMRYTEARLTASAVALMEDLDKETVEVIPNYDETKTEPVVFPAKFPNLLCNGSSGIAVGMATNIPPHNLIELAHATKALLFRPETTIDEIMEHMPGPDFPTGGVICGHKGIHDAYRTGRGRLVVRAKTRFEEIPDSADRQRIVVDELPYNVNKSRLIEHIADLINSKEITGIADLRDESDKDGMRISIDLKRGEMPDVILNQLFKHSEMQTTFGCIMLALDKGLPRLMNVRSIISAWIDHRIDVVRRRTRFELRKAEARAHLLEGYLLAIDNMDEVVRIIRSSANRDEAKERLLERYPFSERQVQAVLELRLYQLTGLEHDKITAEYEELQKKIAELRAILASEQLVRGIIGDELDQVIKGHKSGRRTDIVAAEGDFDIEDLIADEPCLITISTDDYIRRVPMDTFREQRRGGSGVAGFDSKRQSDSLKYLYAASTHDYLMIFTSLGRCYWVKVWQIPETGRRSKGKPLVHLLEDIQPDERIATTLRVRSFDQGGYILLATSKGVVKKTDLEAFSNPRRKGIHAISIDEGDEVITARLVQPGEQVMLFTRDGMAVRFNEEEVRSMGRTARGVRGVSLRDEADLVVGAEVVQGIEDESVMVVCENGFGKRSPVVDFRQTKRGGMGVRSIVINERNGKVVGACSVTDQDGLILMSELGQTIRIRMADVRVMGRNTQGVNLVNLRKGESLVAIQKVEDAGDEDDSLEGCESAATEASEE